MSQWLPWESITHRVAIAGQVTNEQTEAAIAGAQVTITKAPVPFTNGLVNQAQLVQLPDEPNPVHLARIQLKDPAATNDQRLAAAQTILNYLQDRRALPLSRSDSTYSAADGHFHFLDLPDGEYSLTGSLVGVKRRYAPAQVTTTVPRHEAGRIKPAIADIAIPATTLKGRITTTTEEDEQQAVTLAEIRIKETGESTFSDLDGKYALVGLEAADKDAPEKPKYTVLVKTQGYRSPDPPPTVVFEETGDVKTLNLNLEK
ncbi:MAG: hypothetical protein QNJ46_29660 [Leptolyngbyaceae cyanobacterium MO_188.B28]|nr:hypothetical protein [Leptolyngbyaceae cyanobacterium MO_188.B28]